MKLPFSDPGLNTLGGGQGQLRRAALSCFSESVPDHSDVLLQLSSVQWRSLLRWLDISGLALYLFDRLEELDITQFLPRDIEARLRQNVADNTLRMQLMLEEAAGVQEDFHLEGVDFLLLKGFSLVPHSVPRPELRSQLDLDYLVTAESIERARRTLE